MVKFLMRKNSGQAMAEIVVAMGVLILIFSSVIFLGSGYFYRAKCIIATRYAVWSEAREKNRNVSEKELARLYFGGEELSSRLQLKPAEEKEAFARELLGEAGKLLGSVSNTEGKTLLFTFRPPPLSGENIIISSSHFLDGNPWKSDREPGPTLRYSSWLAAGAEGFFTPGGVFIGTVGGKGVGKPF